MIGHGNRNQWKVNGTGIDARRSKQRKSQEANQFVHRRFARVVSRGEDPPVAVKRGVQVEQSVMVPMRDGVTLSTDLYFPVGTRGKLPTILLRTPYNKNQSRDDDEPYMFARAGYVVAVQDVRGKHESGGTYNLATAEMLDGYDAITWLATREWSNGKVGTYGCSYVGENALYPAKLQNPHHTAAIAKGATAIYPGRGLRNWMFYSWGAIALAMYFLWFWKNGIKLTARLPAGTDPSLFRAAAPFFDLIPKLPPIDFGEIWRTLPVIDMMKKAGGPPTGWEECVSHEPADPWWDQFNFISDRDRLDIPTLFLDSWYDYGPGSALELFNLVRRNSVSAVARDNQHIIVTPGIHCRYEQATEHTRVGVRDVGDARFGFTELYLRWFEYWLKGADNGVTTMPNVRVYVIGKGNWREGTEWPFPGTEFQHHYLHSDGRANSRFGGGILSTAPPNLEEADHFVYDPTTPVPTMGGALSATSQLQLGPGSGVPMSGAFDQSDLECRYDVLVYTSAPLSEGVEVTGPVEVVLYVSSSARDTDFTAKLVDVYPDGTAFNVVDGIMRARYREGFHNKVWMREDKVYELTIDLQATSNYFGPQHRIRLEISGSNFPQFDRNLNTGGSNFDEVKGLVARNTVHHSRKYPSRVILPVIR